MSKTFVKISEELLDIMVNELTKLPYRTVQPIFLQLGEDLEEGKEEKPRLYVTD